MERWAPWQVQAISAGPLASVCAGALQTRTVLKNAFTSRPYVWLLKDEKGA